MLGVFGGSFSDTKAIDDHCDLCEAKFHMMNFLSSGSPRFVKVSVFQKTSDFLNVELRCEREMVPHNQALSIKLKPRTIVGVSKCSLPFSSTFSAVSFGEVV